MSAPLPKYLPTNLLPTKRIIEIAKSLGLDFGPGNPEERIRYFVKLGILPHAVRLAVDGQSSIDDQQSTSTIGHLPYWTIQRLIQVDRLKRAGKSYPQIAEKFKTIDARYTKETLKKSEGIETKVAQGSKNLSLPSEEEIEKRLAAHNQEIDKKLKQHKTDLEASIPISPAPSLNPTDYSELLQKGSKEFKIDLSPDESYLSNKPLISLPKKAIVGLAVGSSALILLTFMAFQLPKVKGLIENKGRSEQLLTVNSQTLNHLGTVLAASTETNRLYIDATTEFKGETTFLDDITAPNVVYGVTGGTGISVTTGQNPVVSLNAAGLVQSVNSATGALTLKASGAATISTSGSTITISATDTIGLTAEVDTLATVTSRGATTTTASIFSGGLTVGTGLTFSATAGIANLAAAGTLAFKDGTNTLFTIVDQGTYGTIRLSDKGSTGNPATCIAGDIYFNGTDTNISACTATDTWEQLDAGGVGGIASLSLAGDSGTTQTLTDANTITIAGGTNGIDTAAGATDTITLNLDSTEIGTTTFGSGAAITWTFDASAGTDTTMAWGDNTLTLTEGTTNITSNATTGNSLSVTANSLTSGNAASISSTSTAGTESGTSYLLNLSRSGANSNASHTAYGVYSAVTNTGTTSTNTAGYFSASGATNNYGAYIAPTSGGTTNVGLCFDCDGTWTSSTVASGIQFGTDANAVTLYRSASDTLKTDDSLIVAGTSATITGVEGSNGLILTAGDAVISDGSLLITDDDDAVSLGVTNNTATTIGAGINTAGVIDFSSTSLTTGNLLNLETTTALTTGRMLNISSTSTALTGTAGIGSLANLDWSPGSATTATGDLFALNIGTNGTTTGNLFNILDAGSSLFSVSETAMTSNLPASFNSAGDVAIAYDINFTNPTASYIKSAAPMSLVAGETFNSSDLTLQTYNFGSVIVDSTLTTSSTASTKYALQIATGDTTTTADTVYGLSSVNTLTGAAAKVGYGLYSSVTSSSTTADTLYGIYSSTAQSGVITTGTKSNYGIYSAPTDTAANSGGTTNLYGEYLAPSSTNSTTGATVNVYGSYISGTGTLTTGGTMNQYGLYVANGTSAATGTSTKYGLYVEDQSGADTNIDLNFTASPIVRIGDAGVLTFTEAGGNNTLCTITDASNLGNLSCTGNITGSSSGTSGFWTRTSTTLSPATTNDIVSIANTTTTGADLAITNTGVYTGTGIFNLTANSATTGTIAALSATGMTTGEILDITGTWAAADGSDNEAIDINLTYTPTTLAGTFRGLDLNVTEGANALANTDYALKVTMDNSANTSTGTHTVYGGHFTATGKVAGTTTAVGLYATASGADNNYAAIFDAGNVGIGTTTPGALLDVASGQARISGTTAAANAYGLLINQTMSNGAGTLTGAQIQPVFSGASSFTYGIYSQPATSATAITVGNMSNFYAANPTKGAGSTITTAYGLYIENLTSGADNYSIYSGSAKSYFGGNVGIGTTVPDAALEINHATGDSLRLTYNDSDGTATNYTDFSLSSTGALTLTGSAATLADSAAAEKTFLTLTPGTVTLTGTTTVTSVMDTAIVTGATIAASAATIVSDAAALTVTAPVDSTNATLTRSEAIRINDTTSGAGVLTSLIGLYIAPQTGGATNNYGICFDCDGTWTASTVASGIQFGTDANAVTLYRSASDTLLTGDSFIVGGATSATETLANTGFVMGADDLFVAGMAGVEGSVYTDGSFIAGASTTYGNGSISQTSGETLTIGTTAANLALQTTTSGDITATTGAATGLFNILTGNLKVGAGTPGLSLDGADAYITGTLEVDGVAQFDGGVTFGSTFNCTDCIDFDDIANSPTLDETTDINLSTLDLYVDLTSTGVLAIRDVATAYWTFDDDSTVDVLFPAAGTLGIDASTTANTTTAGVIDLNVTSLTHDNRGLDIAYTSTAAGATTTVTQYGISNVFSSTQAVTATSPTFNYYGLYQTAAKSGADVLTTGGTFSTYGIYATASNTSTDVSAAGTRNTYGGYFDATGASGGTTQAFGLYVADVSGADTNVALCFDCDGTWTSSTVASGIQFGTDANAVTLYRSGNDNLKTDDSLEVGTNLDVQGTIAAGTNDAFQVNTNGGITSNFGASTTNALSITNTSFTTGEAIDVTGTWAPADGSTNEAIDINITHTPTVSADNFQAINLTTTDGTALGNTIYGISNTLTLTGNAAKTGYGNYATVTSTSTIADTLYGGYFTTSHTGQATAGTVNNYALYAKATGDVSAAGAINNYGLYVANGTYDTEGTSAAYGLYVEPIAGADTNVALCFDCDGTWTSSTVASGIQFGTDANAVTLYRSASDTLKTDDALTAAGLITGTAGATVSGATTSINTSSNFDTNINTGTSTGAVSIGNSAAGAIAISTGSTFGLTTTTGSQTYTSSVVSGTTTSSAFVFSPTALTTGTGLYLASSTLTSGQMMNLALSGSSEVGNQTTLGSIASFVSTSTGLDNDGTAAYTLVGISSSGVNATSGVSLTGLSISVANTNSTTNNTALTLSASGDNAGGSIYKALNITGGVVSQTSAVVANTNGDMSHYLHTIAGSVDGTNAAGAGPVGAMTLTSNLTYEGFNGAGPIYGMFVNLGTMTGKSGAANATTFADLVITPATTSLPGGATLTNRAGLYITAAPAGATNNYSIAFGKEAAHNIQIVDSTTANTAGGALTIQSAAGLGTTATAAGGALSLASGAGGALSATASTAGAGGLVSITGANGGATSGVVTGATVGGAGGGLTLAAGTGGAAAGGTTTNTGGAGGAISITAGSAGTGGNASGGTLTLNSGAVTGTGTSTLNLATSNTTALEIGDSTVTKTIDIGGVTSSDASTISIATNSTAADVIAIGNSNASTTLALTGGDDWSITTAGAAAFGGVIQAGGATATTYSRLGTGTAGAAGVTASNDLLISGDLEVDLTTTFDGTVTFNSTQTFNSDVDLVFAGSENMTITNTTNTLGAAGMLDLASTSSTTDTRTLDLSTTFTSTGATTSYGLYNAWASSAVVTGAAVSQTAYGIYNTATKTGADDATGTYSLYGSYNTASNTGRTAVGTVNTYGGYFDATGDAAGTTSAYGVYIDNVSGADTNVALCFDCDGTWTSSTVASGIQFGTDANAVTLYRSASDTLKTDDDLHVQGQGSFANDVVLTPDANIPLVVAAGTTASLRVSANTDGTTAAGGIQFGGTGDTNLYRSAASTLFTDDSFTTNIDLTVNGNTQLGNLNTADTLTGTLLTSAFTSGATTQSVFSIASTTLTTGEIMDITSTHAAADGSDNEAIDINLTYTPTTLAGTFRGLDLNVTEGANALANTDYALKVTMDNSANTSTGTHTVYGGHFTATGKVAGTTTAVGLYATASGADNNYAAIFDAGNVGIGTTSPTGKLGFGTYLSLSTYDHIRLYDDGVGNNAGLGIANTGVTRLYTSNSGTLQFGETYNGLTHMTIAGVTGNVGIGTTGPDAALEINHATGDSLRLTYNDADGSATTYTDFALSSAGLLTLAANGSASGFALSNTQPAAVGTTPGTAATSLLATTFATGGNTTIATTGVGGVGSGLSWTLGTGGTAASAVTASTGGAGGAYGITGGTGGASAVVGTTNVGGAGGAVSLTAGTGGAASLGTSNTGGAGGNASGGTLTLNSGAVTGTGTSTLNLATSNTTALEIGDSTVTKTIDIGGVTSSDASTISIATNSTAADVIAIGNSNASTTLALTGGDDWSITTAGAAAFGSVLQAGGATATTYSRLGTGTAGAAGVTASNDLLISGDLEVDLTTTFDGTVTFNSTQTFNSDVDLVFAGSENMTITNTTNTLGAAGMLDLASTSSTTDTRTLDLSTTFTSTGATTSYGLYNAWASSAVVTGAAVSQTGYGIYNTATKTGADDATGTYSLYGSYNTASNTGRTAAGTVNTYGGYFDATGDAAGTTSAYGVYIDNVSGADTNVALCFDCDGTWTSSTVASGIQFGTDANAVTLYRDGNDLLRTDDGLAIFELRMDRNDGTDPAIYTSGTNRGIRYIANGSGGHSFQGQGNISQFAITSTASAVNYLQVTGATTGNNATLSAQGETNVGINITPKGSGNTIFTAGSVGIGDATPDAVLDIDSTATTTNVFGITNTSFTTGEAIDLTGTWAAADASDNEAIDINLTYTPTTLAGTFRGLDLNVTEGANALANTDYALKVTMDNSANTSVGTHSVYGGHFTTTGKTAGTATAVGLYATATGADNNYAAIFDAGNVGIGTTSPGANLQVDGSSNVSTVLIGGTNSGANANSLLVNQTLSNGAGTLAGAQIQPTFSGGSSNAYGIYSQPATSATAITVASLSNFYAANPTKGAGSTITTAYGLYLESISSGSTNYSIYSAGGTNYFGGNVGIGTTAPDARLEINHATGDSLRLTYNDSNGSATNYTDFSLGDTGALTLTGSAATLADGASAEKTFLTLTPGTITLTGTTTVTSVMDTAIVTGATIAASAATIVSDAAALTVTAPVDSTNATLTRSEAIRINDTTSGAGVLTSLIGLYIAPQTGGATNNYGICFDCDGTWTSSTVASGIQFGTDANAVTLYRSASDTLKTDDDFSANNIVAAGNINLNNILYSNNDIYLDLDENNDGSNSLFVRDGANATILTLAESGNITATGTLTGVTDLTVNGNTQLGNSNTVDTLTGTLLTSAFTSGATTQSVFSVASTTLTTGEIMDITSTHAPADGSTNEAIDINITHTPTVSADNFRGIELALTDATALANTVYGMVLDVQLSGNAGKIGTGIQSSISSASTTSDILYGFYAAPSLTAAAILGGVGTRSVYGVSSNPIVGAESTAGITNVYGVYSKADGDVAAGGTINNYGLYVANGTYDTEGTSASYGLYVEPIAGADTNVALCFDCDGTWTSSTVASGIQFGTDANAVTLYRSASDTLKTDDSLLVAGTSATITGVEGSNGLILTAGDAAISDGSLLITDDDDAVSLGVTNNTATTIGAGINTAGVIDFSSTSLTTGNLLNLETTTALTTGRMLNISSTSTALTGTAGIGSLANLDWSPGSATTATGDLFSLNIGTNGTTTGNLFNILDAGSSLFSVSETAMTSNLPASFNSAGDVAIAYDINFTNPTASYIKSAAPMYLTAGETFNSSDLTLQTYNFGSVIVDSTLTSSSTASTKYALQIATGDTTTTADTIYGLSSVNTLTGAAAKVGYGLYSSVTSSSTTADTLYGLYSATTQSGASTSGTKSNYGLYLAPTDTGVNTSTATVNLYGGYTAPSSVASTTATVNVYGQYIANTAKVTSTGIVNSYGLYIANGTMDTVGTSTQYGLYVASPTGADTNYAAIFAGGNVGIGDTTPDYLLDVAGTLGVDGNIQLGDSNTVDTLTGTLLTSAFTSGATTQTANSFAGTAFTTGEILDITSTHAPADGSTNEAIDINITHTPTVSADNFKSIKLTTTDGTALGNTISGINNIINLSGNAAKDARAFESTFTDTSTTADTIRGILLGGGASGALAAGQTRSIIGFNSAMGSTAATSEATATLNLYGARLLPSSTLATAGTDNVYGTYISNTATHAADAGTINSYGLYIANGTMDTVGASTQYGIYVAPQTGADNNYGICFDCDGTFGTQTVASGIAWGTDATTANNIQIYRSANGTFLTELGDGTDLILASAADFKINLGAQVGGTAQRLCHAGADASTGVESIGDCGATQADLAEYYGVEGGATEGDLVAKYEASQVETDKGPTFAAAVKKSSTAYDPNILGIISTNPAGEILGEASLPYLKNPKPVALAGRVPVKVSTENGPIKSGDSITSSSTPGVGMKATKAGRVIGMALESFACSSSDGVCQSKILVFVNPSNYLGTLMAQTILGEFAIENFGQPGIDNAFYNADGTLKEQFEGQILTAEQIDRMIKEGIAYELENQQLTQGDFLTASQDGSLGADEASSSAQLLAQANEAIQQLNNLLASTNVPKLTVTESAFLPQTQFAGAISQDGTLIIDQGKQLNVLGSALYLQNNIFAQDPDTGKILDIGSGKVTIDKFGNVVISGELTTDSIETKELGIKTQNIGADTVGSATLDYGSVSKTIYTTAVKPGAKILVTATTATGGRNLYVSQKLDYEGFVVTLDGTRAAQNIEFDWLIVSTLGQR